VENRYIISSDEEVVDSEWIKGEEEESRGVRLTN